MPNWTLRQLAGQQKIGQKDRLSSRCRHLFGIDRGHPDLRPPRVGTGVSMVIHGPGIGEIRQNHKRIAEYLTNLHK